MRLVTNDDYIVALLLKCLVVLKSIDRRLKK